MSGNRRLDKIEARVNGATKGPWEAYTRHAEAPGSRNYIGGGVEASDSSIVEDQYMRANDAEFIAAARDDVPAMAAALRAVLKLHSPNRMPVNKCRACGFLFDLCPINRAIGAALGDAP